MAKNSDIVANDPSAGPANTAALVALQAAGDVIQLPRGTVTLADQITINDSAGPPKWVAHDGGTAIKVTGQNVRTLVLWGRGIYRNGNVTFSGPNGMKVPSDAAPIPAGSWVRAFRYNGYLIPDGLGMLATLAKVVAAGVGGKYVLDRTVPAGCNQIDVYGPGTMPVREANDGSSYLTPATTPAFPAGTLLYITAGQVAANEATGEYRTVVEYFPRLRLDRPLRRMLPDAVAVPMAPAAGVRFEGIDFLAPTHPQIEPLFAKYAYGVRFTGCRFGVTNGYPALCTCADVCFDDCASDGNLMTNTCHDVRVACGQWGGLDAEESCTDLEISGVLIVPRRHGVRADDLGNRGVRVRDCRIEGAGNVADAQGNRFSALFLTGTDHEVSRMQVVATQPGSASYCGGGRLRMEGVDFDVNSALYLTGGTDCLLSAVRGPWVEALGGTGLAAGCPRFKGLPGWRVT